MYGISWSGFGVHFTSIWELFGEHAGAENQKRTHQKRHQHEEAVVKNCARMVRVLARELQLCEGPFLYGPLLALLHAHTLIVDVWHELMPARHDF